MNQKFKYHCSTCQTEFSSDKILYLCPECELKYPDELPPKGILKVFYDYENLINRTSFKKLKQDNWFDLLPINDLDSLPKIKIGNTPLYHFQKLGKENLGFFEFPLPPLQRGNSFRFLTEICTRYWRLDF